MYLLKHAMSMPPSEMAQQVEEDQPPAGEALNIDDTSLGIVLSLVGLHLSCRDLIRLQVLSKEWRKWCTEIAPPLWEARKRDNAPDWYFPTWLVPNDESLLSPRHWYGIHHPSGTGHRLPGLEFLELGPNWRVEVLTGAGGLLLLYAVCEINIRETRLVGSKMCEEEVKDIGATHRVPGKRLIVCNPLTKRWKVLSEMDQSIPMELKHLYPALLRFAKRPVYDYDEVTCPSKEDTYTCVVAIHIMVNSESSSYEIVIIWVTGSPSKNYLVEVYDSGMDRWEASTSPKHNEFTLGSVCLNRRIYLLEQVGELHVVARVFLVDSRTWLPDDYTLLTKERYIDAYCGGPRRSRTGPCPALVACSSGIYAIVPVREDFNAHHGSYCWRGWCIKHRKICSLDLNFEGNVRFDLFKLQEEQIALRQELFFKMRMNFGEPQISWNVAALGPDNLPCRACTWYRCASKGSVIWIACGDLLLQFDMVTRSSKSGTVLCDEFTGFETMGEIRENYMPYEPSFCTEP